MHRPLRLFGFNGGTITTKGVRFINRQGLEETRDMADPNHCFLVQHPDGLLMWDTGLPDYIAGLPEKTLERGKFRFGLDEPLRSQLDQAGFSPENIDLLAFSHLQVDHAGNTCLFSNARVLLQEDEYAMAFGSKAADWGYIREDYACLLDRELLKISGDLDVFGDGSVLLLSAPGHTPGHQVLYIHLPEFGPVLLSGDLYYAPKDPEEGWMPAWNVNRPQTIETFDRLAKFALDHQARWLINHSQAHREQLALAPAWLQ